MARMRSLLALVVLVTAEAAAVAGLWRLGDRPWAAIDLTELWRWLAVTPPADALAAVLRVVALVVAVHVLCSTVLYLLARCSGAPRALRAARWVTLPVVRRVADRAVAVALTAGTALGGPTAGLAAAAEAPIPVLVPADEPPVGVVAPADEAPAPLVAPPEWDAADTPAGSDVAAMPALSAWVPGLPRAVAASGAPPAVLAAPPPPAPPGAQAAGPVPVPAQTAETGRAGGDVPEAGMEEALVAPGDNLWALSAERVAAATGREVPDLADREVHAYWVTVLAANRDRIPSGDPDLLHPGIRVLLPPAVR